MFMNSIVLIQKICFFKYTNLQSVISPHIHKLLAYTNNPLLYTNELLLHINELFLYTYNKQSLLDSTVIFDFEQ